MTFRKYAALDVLDAWTADAAGLRRTAHKHTFEYTPRLGFLYVRSRAISSRINDNFDHFPAEEIAKSYRTFVGKPVFVNHHNDNHRRARGVIIDAALHEDVTPQGLPDTWVEVLMEIDAVRFPKLAKAILAGHIDRTSMGVDVASSECSACGNVATTPLEYCAHIPGKKGQKLRRTGADGSVKDQLIYETCRGLTFFENSVLVEDPADPTAFFLGVDDRGVRDLGHRYVGSVPHEALRKTAAMNFVMVSGGGSHQFELHIAGCPDLSQPKYSIGDRDQLEADNWQAALDKWLDGQMRSLGYSEADVRVYPCAKTGQSAAREVKAGQCPGTGQPFNERRLLGKVPCPVCGKLVSGGNARTMRVNDRVPAHTPLGATGSSASEKPEPQKFDVEDGKRLIVHVQQGGRYDKWQYVYVIKLPTGPSYIDFESGFRYPTAEAAMEAGVRNAGVKSASRTFNEKGTRMASRRTASRRRTASIEWEDLGGQGWSWGDEGSDDWVIVGGGRHGEYSYHGRVDGMVVADSGFRTLDEAKRAAESDIEGVIAMSASRRRHAYGETVAPAEVNTLREQNCPVCSEEKGFNGEKCNVCGYIKPPDIFMDPDLSKAQKTDLRQQQDAIADEAAGGDDGLLELEGDEKEVAPDGGFHLTKPEGIDDEQIEIDDDEVIEGSDDDDEDDDSEEDDGFTLKRKKKTTSARRNRAKETTMRQKLSVVAALAAENRRQKHALQRQAIQINAQQRMIDMIAKLAGIENQLLPIKREAARRVADLDNPAQPVEEGATEPASESTEEALGDISTDAPGGGGEDVEKPGVTDESDVTPTATTDVTEVGTSSEVPEGELDLSNDDVTKPVEGAAEPIPVSDRRTEGDVTAIDEVRTETAFPIENEEFTQTVTAAQQRVFASLRLARLQIQAGIENGNDLVLGQKIATSKMSDSEIAGQIRTLEAVVQKQASSNGRPASMPVSRQAQRAVPSMATTPGIQRAANAVQQPSTEASRHISEAAEVADIFL